MSQIREGEWAVSLDEADPLHAEMLRYLRAIRKRGRYSPVRRILTRWASNGYLLELGRIPGGGTAEPIQVFDALVAAGLLAGHATAEAVAETLSSLHTSSPQSRPRLDLAEAQREIAAITAAAEHIDFE